MAKGASRKRKQIDVCRERSEVTDHEHTPIIIESTPSGTAQLMQ